MAEGNRQDCGNSTDLAETMRPEITALTTASCSCRALIE